MGEGGEEEADEDEAAEVGGSQGEQAKKYLRCRSHLQSYWVQSLFSTKDLSRCSDCCSDCSGLSCQLWQELISGFLDSLERLISPDL